VKCLRGHDYSVGRVNRRCVVCKRDSNREWMRRYRLRESPRRRREILIYNRTVRYDRRSANIISKLEKKIESLS